MHAFLIIAHHQFELLEKIIKCLDDERNDIYIHINANVKNFDKNRIASCAKKSNVYFTERVSIKWGSFDMVRCEYILMLEALKKNVHYDYYHLISGADLPLCSQDEMHRFFEENKGKEFIHFGQMPLRQAEIERVKYYHFASGRRNYFNRAVTKGETLLQRMLRVDRLKGLKVGRGSQWFSITDDFLKYVVSQKDFVFKQFKNTYIPDEFFLQTLLINSKFKDNLFMPDCRNNHYACVRYIDWNRGHPYTFRLEDYDEIMSSGCMFARKFDLETDRDIIEKITQTVMNA